MNGENKGIFVTLTVVFAVIGCLGLALGIYLQFEGFFFNETLEIIGRGVSYFSLGLLVIAGIISVSWIVRKRGFFSTFTETRGEKIAEIVFVVLTLMIILIPEDNPLDDWTPSLFAALAFLYVGIRIWMKPPDEGWRHKEKLGHGFFVGLAILNLLAQFALILLR